MGEYTWENIVAYTVWKCKLCGALSDRDGIGGHLLREHHLKSVELSKDIVYSPYFKCLEVLASKE